MPHSPAECQCMQLPYDYRDYESSYLGCDKTNGRFGDVTILKCRHCGRLWINYLVQYEAFSKSGRYFKGLITEEKLKTITPETTVEHLESLDWHFYGGSYFDGHFKGSKGKLKVDPF